jgi:molybdopterin-guanine dinucleotide biosynthesis protein A
MGSDKAFVEVDGKPMAVRVADALWEAGCHPVWCQGGDPGRLGALGFECRPDPEPAAGPVTAVLAALRTGAGPIVVAACDLPDLTAATVAAVIAAGSTHRDRVTVAVADGRRHLLSYWPAAAEAALSRLVADGVHAFHAVLAALDAVEVEVEPGSVRNVNAPGDLAGRGRP